MNNNENLTEVQESEQNIQSDSPIYNKEEKTIGFKVCTAICAVVLLVVTCICFGLFFNTESMYFVRSPMIYVFASVIFILAVSVAAICIFSKRHLAPSARRASNIINFATALELLYLLIVFLIDKNYWMAVLTLPPVLYFTGIFNKSIVARTLLGFGASIWCAAIIVSTYFNYSIAVNSPFKLICQFGLALSMLLIVSEIRFDLDAGNPKIYMLLACLAFCINLAALCAQITLCVRGTSEIPIYFASACAMTIYSSKIFLARIFHDSKSTSGKTDEPGEEPSAE